MTTKKRYKRYKLEYDFEATMVIEIDHAVFTPEVFKEHSEFWSNKPNLEDWLVMVYRFALNESITGRRDLKNGTEEGFPKMDGSAGITIVSFDEFEFDSFHITYAEIE